MTRINTNVPSLIAQNRLQQSNNSLQTALTRLSTGLRINSGSDDPAGLIASEALRSEITGLNKAITNTKRASQIISTADSALGQVSSLLNDIRGLVVEAANEGALSPDEIAANQLQIDSSLEALNRIAQTTTFQGRKLLDGSLDFITSAGQGFGTVRDLTIEQANLGATGQVSVDVDVSAAATRAAITASGIPTATTPAFSAGTLTFESEVADASAAGTVNLANSFTIGAEASGAIALANATTPDEQAEGTLTLGDSGLGLEFEVQAGSAADGTTGNGVIIEVTVGASTTGSYDAATNTLSITLEEGADAATIAAALDTELDGFFDVAAVAGAEVVDAADAGTYTGVLAGGTDQTDAGTGFQLTARDGGAADGAIGNDTTVTITTGAVTSASYDAETNELIITAAAGATVSEIAAAINTSLGDDWIASNVVNGSYAFASADVGTSTPLTGGTNPGLAGQFILEAVDGGAADGTVGNETDLVFASGATTEATYDADSNTLTVTVADGATIDDVATAINNQGTFLAKNVLNGTAVFSTDDLGTTSPLSGGTDQTVNDVITVTADVADPAFDGPSISVVGTNALAAGEASAEIDNDGNIVVNVSTNGAVAMGTIAAAIDGLDGFSAAVTTSDGTGQYLDGISAAPDSTDLAGGQFGGGLTADLVIQLTGSDGAEVFQFERGSSLGDVLNAINLVSDSTGVQAVDDAGSIRLESTTYGSRSVVALEVISEGAGGQFASNLSASRSNGTDIQATINGTTATASGNTFSINTSTLSLSMTVEAGSSDNISFDITGGGALFQLGSNVVSNQQARMGISSVSTGKLGGNTGRLYELGSGQARALSNDAAGAAKIVDEVINKVTSLRGRLGAFQATTLESNLVSLNDTVANLQEAESSIRDADFAAESANLTRAQILVQSGTNVLALANQNPQNVLALLR